VLEDSLPTQIDRCNNAQPPQGGPGPIPQPNGNTELTTPGQQGPQPRPGQTGSRQEATQLALPIAQQDQSRGTGEGCPRHGAAIPRGAGGGPSHCQVMTPAMQQTPARVPVWPGPEEVWNSGGDQRWSGARGVAAGGEGVGRGGLDSYPASSNIPLAPQTTGCPPTGCCANNGTPDEGPSLSLPGSCQAHIGRAPSLLTGLDTQGVGHRPTGSSVPGGHQPANEGARPGSVRPEAGVGVPAAACGGVPQQAANLDPGAAEILRSGGVEGAREAFIIALMEVDICIFSGIAAGMAMWSHLNQVSPQCINRSCAARKFRNRMSRY